MSIARLATAVAIIALAAGCASMIAPARAADLTEPPMLPAAGSPDLLMVARPQLLPFPGQPAGYTYEVCPRPTDPAARRCPAPGRAVNLQACPTETDPAVSPYGGVRLQLTPGQTLRIRLVNCLPPSIDAEHAQGDPLLRSNPTNLHTHGLIVEPRRADDADDPFGDYIFVLDLAPGVTAPVMPAAGAQDHARSFDFRQQVVDYAIPIPRNHPAGLFWFHPHVHGLSLNQVSGGLAGIITVGDVHSYACDRASTCAPGRLQAHVRHLVLKDTQVTSGSQVRFQENPSMCATPDAAGNVAGCLGAATSSGTTGADDDGRWEFTINGQSYPTIAVHPAGEIWRIANASASVSYNLGLYRPAGDLIVFQILALDGVSLVLPAGSTAAQASALLGGRATVVPCPASATPSAGHPVCATSLRMMPSARAELFLGADAARGEAVLRTLNRQTGKDGDDWPRIDLARVTFPDSAAPAIASAMPTLAVVGTAALVPGGVLDGAVTTRLDPASPPVPLAGLASQPGTPPSPVRQARLAALQPQAGLDCTPLAAGRARQVLFGVPANPDHFGLGYRVVATGDTSRPTAATAPAIVEFDHAALPTVCVQLGRNNETVTETWMLVNLAGEDHNFHMHQTRFTVVSMAGATDTTLPPTVNGEPVLLDNVPLPHATGEACDGTVGPWIAGTCTPSFVTVSIPFHEVGDFVYHCHILEHEDGGMMAKIEVVPHQH